MHQRVGLRLQRRDGENRKKKHGARDSAARKVLRELQFVLHGIASLALERCEVLLRSQRYENTQRLGGWRLVVLKTHDEKKAHRNAAMSFLRRIKSIKMQKLATSR
jgi:hypothetical protein